MNKLREYRVVVEDIGLRETRYGIHLVFIHENGFMQTSTLPDRVSLTLPDWDTVRLPLWGLKEQMQGMIEALDKPQLCWREGRLVEYAG